jgi:hypothetical protein
MLTIEYKEYILGSSNDVIVRLAMVMVEVLWSQNLWVLPLKDSYKMHCNFGHGSCRHH